MIRDNSCQQDCRNQNIQRTSRVLTACGHSVRHLCAQRVNAPAAGSEPLRGSARPGKLPQAASARDASGRPGINARRSVSRVLSRPRGSMDGHSSWPIAADRLQQPTRTSGAVTPARRTAHDIPIRSCSRRGLPCRLRCRRRGGLLPHPFTLTPGKSLDLSGAVCFLWHFP